MKDRWKNAWKALRGNRGSGVVLVMIAISCITLMATTLMVLSYTGFKIKATEKQSKADMYAAESKAEQLMGCIQDVVSTAIAEAHKTTLTEYYTSTDQSDVDATNTAKFHNAFLKELEEQFKASDTKYNVDILKNLLNDSSVAFTDDATCTYKVDTVHNQFILENIRFTYTNDTNGNTTSVKTDMVIDAPDFLYVKVNSGVTGDSRTWDVEKLVKLDNWSIN